MLLPSSLTVPGPLSARNPLADVRLRKRGNPTGLAFFPARTAFRYVPKASMAWPKSTMAYLLAF